MNVTTLSITLIVKDITQNRDAWRRWNPGPADGRELEDEAYSIEICTALNRLVARQYLVCHSVDQYTAII